jgi:hypothetical protein
MNIRASSILVLFTTKKDSLKFSFIMADRTLLYGHPSLLAKGKTFYGAKVSALWHSSNYEHNLFLDETQWWGSGILSITHIQQQLVPYIDATEALPCAIHSSCSSCSSCSWCSPWETYGSSAFALFVLFSLTCHLKKYESNNGIHFWSSNIFKRACFSYVWE